MISELKELKSKICDLKPPVKSEQNKIEEYKKNTVIVLMAGGESSRFKSVPGSENSNKNAFTLPNGDTMIEMAIRMYKDAGFTEFVALVFHHAETVTNLLGDGSKYGVKISYSHDPEKPIGKGGAVLNAINNGVIPKNKNIIIHNPDDVIIGYSGSFPDDIVNAQIEAELRGCLCTVVVTEESPFEFSGMSISDNLITDIQYQPMIPIPSHVGVTIFSYKSFPYFEKYIDLNQKTDFETTIFPVLSSEKKLYGVSIPYENWIAVNNLKSYNNLLKRL